MPSKAAFAFVLLMAIAAGVFAKEKMAGDELFTGPVPNLKIEIPPDGMQVLQRYHQVVRQQHPERIDVHVTIREGEQVYNDVALHLKGSYSFQGIDDKPSMTLNFDKFVPGRLFHGLSKIHLNNSVQDPTALSEQFARGIFQEAGIVCARATPARVQLNGRDLGVCVLVEGANKSFVQRNFKSAKGNLYDAGAGQMDIDKDLPLLSGKQPPDRSDLKALVEAARETDPHQRLERLEKILDVDKFITFAAIEALLVHWDGYCGNCNNYRIYHDPTTGKFIFMPHGMDQLFGSSNSTDMSLIPAYKGMLAKSLLSISEARQRYFKRVEELSKSLFKAEALQARLDKLAARLQTSLGQGGAIDGVDELKSRIDQRMASVAKQLANPPKPLQFAEDGTAKPTGWRFKSDPTYAAQGNRMIVAGHELLRLRGPGRSGPGGTWRTSVLLAAGHYEFTGLARTRGDLDPDRSACGVMLRISGETSVKGMALADDWKTLSYSFDVRGMEQVELVCEFRGPPGGLGEFDAASLRLTRSEPKKPELRRAELNR